MDSSAFLASLYLSVLPVVIALPWGKITKPPVKKNLDISKQRILNAESEAVKDEMVVTEILTKTAPVFTGASKKSDIPLQKSDMPVQKSDTPAQKSDIPLQKSENLVSTRRIKMRTSRRRRGFGYRTKCIPVKERVCQMFTVRGVTKAYCVYIKTDMCTALD